MSPTGHLAIGFAAKKYAPQVPVVVFLIAAYAIDLIYFIFLAIGLDTIEYNPWSHSLLMAIIWSVSAGLAAFFLCKKVRSGIAVGLVVMSHWGLDILVWDNVPIFFNKTYRIGFGLYNRIGFSLTGIQFDSGTVIATSLELGMLIISLVIYIVFRLKSHQEKAGQPA